MSTVEQTVLRAIAMRYRTTAPKPKIIVDGKEYTEEEFKKLNTQNKCR